MAKAVKQGVKSSRAEAKKTTRVVRESSQRYLLNDVEKQPSASLVSGITKLNGGFTDSAFGDNKLKPIHRWVPWIAGFSSEFVRDIFSHCLPRHANTPATVLDPFCGVGTTLVEALLHGHHAIGFEINPYAALASRAKLEAAALSPSQLHSYIIKFQDYMTGIRSGNGLASPPPFFNTRIPFFGALTEAKVLRALRFIRGIRVPPVRDVFSLAFGSVMVSLSNYSYEPSLSSRPAVGKPIQEDAPVMEALVAKLLAMYSDIAWLREAMAKFDPLPKGKVVADSFMNARHHLEPQSIDLAVTSPPYLNNYHYVRNTRPQLFWLGFVRKAKDLKRLETENFGKYWQTVRDSEPLALNFDMPELQKLVDQLRSINVERGSYGGPGWANYATAYFNDTDRFCETLAYVLKPKANAVVVVGNSILQGVEIQIDNVLAELAHRHGLRTENIHIIRQKRVGASIVSSSVRQGARSTASLYESAVILRKD